MENPQKKVEQEYLQLPDGKVRLIMNYFYLAPDASPFIIYERGSLWYLITYESKSHA